MEIWSLYQSSQLHPESPLTGCFERIEKPVDLNSVMREINDTLKEEAARKLFLLLRQV
jgi:RIO kinase 1